ncbi:MAG TPA: hypothetical protein VGS07_20650 [Thermoanaerobaculia bacterium]|jgi:hypothetical protein|nr:hypothetical protein [Thermoanaerobaculia bacterium]
MSSKLSAEEILSHLETRAVVLRERAELHAQQEAHHREQRAAVAAELEKVQMNLEALRTALDSMVDLPLTAAAPAAMVVEKDLPAPGRLMVGRLVRRVALTPGLAEPFGATNVAAEVNRRYPDRLEEPVGTRVSSDVLRRMLAEGELDLVRKGKASHEAWYRRR